MTSPPPTAPAIQRRHLKQTSLSYSQESLWFLQQLDPENAAYHSSILLRFTGGIDRPSLEKALNELVRRHEPLRTIYPNQGGKPVQVIRPFEPFSLPYVDYSALAEEERRQAISRYVSEHGDQPFDLQRGPLVRLALLHTSPNEDHLFFCTHHIGFDAWSRQIFYSELMQLYDAYRSGREPAFSEMPIQYSDYAAWQRDWLQGETLEAYLEHWKQSLAGDLPVLEMPTDRPRPILQSFRGARYHFRLPASLSSRLKDFCQRERFTPFHLLLAAYAVLLRRYSGQEDIILGCPFANRARAEVDGLIGFFVNTLPVRLNLSGNPVVMAFLDQVRSVMLEDFTWQAAPFEALVSEISPQRDLSRTPVFQVTINLRNVPQRPVSIAGLVVENVPRENAPSPFDLSLDFGDDKDGVLAASLQYNTDLFDEGTIVHMVAHYQNLLGEMLLEPDSPVGELEMLTPSEKKRIVIDWNDTRMDFPQVCIQDLFDEQAEKNPEALAVACNGISLTYGLLAQKANRLAHYLRANGVAAEARVGIYLPRSEQVVVSLLAILKAGGAYVPLDLTYPAERTAYMVEDSDPAAVITLSHLCSQLPDRIRKICLDAESDLIDASPWSKPEALTNNDALAYVMYTSGSTGRPKGAMNTHKGIVNYLNYLTKHFQFSNSDRVVQFASLSYDGSVLEIFGALSCGGALFLLDDSQMRDPDFIYETVVDRQATFINLVPTMLRAICESAESRGPKETSLRLIAPGGEVLRAADVELARRVFGESVKLVNQYGPTECSISPTNYPIPEALPNGLQVVPIGRPIQNARTYILDDHFHPVPTGVKGELFIGGIGVGRGYWNRPDLTAERFLPDPFWPGGRMYRTGDIVRQLPDGTICFLGRSDDQVKIRGYRVELSEIEAVVNEFPGVKEAAAVLWRQEGVDNLAVYITILEGIQEPATDRVHAYLADRLPFYMLPSAIVVLEKMPLTPNRKIDRAALPRPDRMLEAEHWIAPRNPVEERMVSIWQEILGVQRIGVRDNFFELGGHSLIAIRLFNRIEEEFHQSLPLLLLFKEGTVEALAAALNQPGMPPQPEGCIPVQVEGSRPPFFCVSPTIIDVVTYRELSRALGPDQPFYALYTPRRPQPDGVPFDTVDYFLDEIRHVQPLGPYYLGGYSGGGRTALEMAHRLQVQGERVELVVLMEAFAPGYPVRLPWVTPGVANFLRVLSRVRSYLWKFWILDWPGKRHLLLSRERPFPLHLREWVGKRRRELQRPWRMRSVPPANPEQDEGYRGYGGKVVVLRARQGLIGMRPDPTLGWGSWLPSPPEVHVVPGEHESILFGPRLPMVAGILKDNLEKAYQHQHGPSED